MQESFSQFYQLIYVPVKSGIQAVEISFLLRGDKLSLRWFGLGSDWDVSWARPTGVVPCKPNWRDYISHRELHILSGLATPSGTKRGAGEHCWEKDFWFTLLLAFCLTKRPDLSRPGASVQYGRALLEGVSLNWWIACITLTIMEKKDVHWTYYLLLSVFVYIYM